MVQTGSPGDDSLVGDAGDNLLGGGAGNDGLNGQSGAKVIALALRRRPLPAAGLRHAA